MFNKIFSFLRIFKIKTISIYNIFICRVAMKNVTLGNDTVFHPNVYISCTDGGTIEIGNNVAICRNAQLIARGGAIIIGDNVHIGDGSIIVSREKIEIGKDTLLGEYVVVRDQNHAYKTRPIRHAGFEIAPIFIGEDVWLGAKATILKGSHVAAGSIIGAHALVNGSIEEKSLAAGIPAKVIKSI